MCARFAFYLCLCVFIPTSSIPELEHYFLLQVDGTDDAETAMKCGREVETTGPGNGSSKKVLATRDSSHDQTGVNTNIKNAT